MTYDDLALVWKDDDPDGCENKEIDKDVFDQIYMMHKKSQEESK